MRSWREFALSHTAKTILPMIARMSEGERGGLFHIAERLAMGHFGNPLVRALAQMGLEGRPAAELGRRIIRQTSPHCRSTLITNFILRHVWQGGERRNKTRTEDGLWVPWTYLISPTMRCNLRCAGCYAGSYSQKDDLEFGLIDRVLAEGKELGIYLVTILGGEPFVSEDMWEIYRRHNDVAFLVFTNGTLMSKEAAAKLGQLGNVFPLFSIEGFEAETDARRGRGAFRKVMQGMDNLREAGVPFGFSSMVTRYNVDTILSDEFTDMLIAKGCLMGWHFLYMPVGREPDTNLMPTPEQRERMRVEGARRIRATKPIFVADFWNDAPYVGGCIAGGRHYFHINSCGDVEPCIFCHFAVDNIKEKSLREVLNSPFFRAIRARQPFNENLLRPCMLIDNPHEFRQIWQEQRPYSTHPGADCLVTNLSVKLDEYAEGVAKVLDPAWERDFVAKGFRTSPVVPSPAKEVVTTHGRSCQNLPSDFRL